MVADIIIIALRFKTQNNFWKKKTKGKGQITVGFIEGR